MGITTPAGKEYFVAAAFPSACGKTNLAMIKPTLPGYTVRCVGKYLWPSLIQSMKCLVLIVQDPDNKPN